MGIAATYATAFATTTRKIARLAGEMNSVPQITAVIAFLIFSQLVISPVADCMPTASASVSSRDYALP